MKKSFTKYQDKDKADLDAGRPLQYQSPKIRKEMARKMKVGHSDERHLLYRTLKNKEDYGKMHLKSTAIHPSKRQDDDHQFEGSSFSCSKCGGSLANHK